MTDIIATEVLYFRVTVTKRIKV